MSAGFCAHGPDSSFVHPEVHMRLWAAATASFSLLLRTYIWCHGCFLGDEGLGSRKCAVMVPDFGHLNVGSFTIGPRFHPVPNRFPIPQMDEGLVAQFGGLASPHPSASRRQRVGVVDRETGFPPILCKIIGNDFP
ncbi:hypothetical protein M9435_002975 [Picochlorum sp. BPE23]|nr:hypothetical protein M9435_002975 [Picochlorum sp. BPE23]